MNIQVEKVDITEMGFTHYNENGYLAVMCKIETQGIELIILRSILKCFGDQYKVVKEDYGFSSTCAIFITNLPHSIYLSCILGDDE